MKNNIKRFVVFVTIVLLSITINGCGRKKENVAVEDSKVQENTNNKVFDENIEELSAWIVYWDLNVDREINALGSQLKEICYFGAYFDENNNLIIPEKLLNFYNERKTEEYTNYLTIVNDKVNGDGTSSLKDKDLLKDLLGDEEDRKNHVKSVIELVLQYDFNGIEIDYEQIKNNMEVWDNYLVFVEELYNGLKEKDLKLRIVLEPSTPLEKLKFIEGPEYVMMCYNLHGAFSEAGEKANPIFIQELISSMEDVPGRKSFALATGGFDWSSDGKVTSLTENEAKSLIKTKGIEAKRHEESKCLVFNFVDDESVEHEVWYADVDTLNEWMKVIDKNHYSISIWRLGHNNFNK